MNARSRSITRSLIVRMALACLVLTALVGTGTYLLERQRIQAAVEERATLGIELLRARVRHLAASTGEPWQGVVPRALAQLAQDMPATGVGRFAFVEIFDVDGRPLASMEDPSHALPVALVRQQGFPADPAHLVLARVAGTPRGTLGVTAPVTDLQGNRVARINGVFLIAPSAIADAERRLTIAVLTAIAVVIATTLLIYPIIRRLVQRLAGLSAQLLDANLETLQVLGNAIAKRDSDTDDHNYRVTIYSVHLAEKAGADGALVRRLVKGAFLHDVGKIGVRDHILLKPGRLDADEFEIMKTHVSHGLDIVGRSEWLADACEVIGGHHEQYTGKGYYRGLRGDAIPLTARVFAIADVFDALTSERPYKKPMPVEQSVAILREGAGQHFDPDLVAHFAAIAAGLHARFAGDPAAARNEVAEIIRRYFRADLGAILDEAPAAR